jgi:hypothetical protein
MWLLVATAMIFGLVVAGEFPLPFLFVSISIFVWSGYALAGRTRSLLALFYSGSRLRVAKAVGSGAYGVLMLLIATAALGTAQMQKERAAAESKRDEALARSQQAASKRRRDELLTNSGSVAASFRATLDSVEGLLKSAKARDALGMLTREEPVVQPYLTLRPVPPNVAALSPRYVGLKQRATEVVGTLDQIEKAQADVRDAEARMSRQDWITANEELKSVVSTLAAIAMTDDIRAQLPKNVSLQKLAADAQRLSARAKPHADKALGEIAKHAAYLAVCGRKPVCGGWDGECTGLEAHVRQTANDPDSIDVERCTDPVLTEARCWMTQCDVRGKNAFGALVLQRQTFMMSTLGIESR